MKTGFKRVVATTLVALSLVAFPFTGSAATLKELRDEKSALDATIAAANQKASELRSESAQVMEFVAALRLETEALQAQIDNLDAQVSTLRAQIDALNVKIDEQQAKFDKHYKEYSSRLRAIYVSGSVTQMELLMSSGDMSDLLVRAEMINSVGKQDSAALNELIKVMEQIEADKKSLTDSKKTLDANMADLETHKTDLNTKMAESQSIINTLEQQAYAYSESVSDDKDQLDKIEDEIVKLARNSINGGIIGTGQMTMPCPGYSYVSAGYPNYSSGSFHGGVDFAAPYGTTIIAADSGTVIAANYWSYSFGRHIMISHGNGIVTLYGHASELLVSVGQNVQKGQAIARVGSTGNSTGNHLHFEVRVDGSRDNPWNYL